MTERRCRKCGADEAEAPLALLSSARYTAPTRVAIEWECKDDAACLLRQRGEDPARNAAKVLHRDPAITCQQDVPDPGCDCQAVPCPNLSWFVVERSDGDKSFGWDGKHEACEYHLADVIDGMLGGDEKLHAIVTPRWWDDGPEAGQ
jgi:hypothetical protein